ncbi:unnamed protein product, partial [marine sediment metagenome]
LQQKKNGGKYEIGERGNFDGKRRMDRRSSVG